jgi:acetyl esterase/lipase
MEVRPQMRRPLAAVVILAALVLVCWRTWARPAYPPQPAKPEPDLANIRYGPHDRNILDLWKAKPDRKGGQTGLTPLVVFFHGGGFRMGDKSSVPGWLIARCQDAGISVASANYRLSQDAPYPAPMCDGARAIQFLRHRAAQFGLDPDRIAASGNSAGAGIALWVGFHDDLADPRSPDPVARQSTRLLCLGVDGAQTSYDPRFIHQLIGGRAHEHPALKWFYGLPHSELDTPKAHRLYEEASPITHVSAGDPPAILFYTEPDEPLPAGARDGQGIHHPRFGRALKASLDPLGIACILRHSQDFPEDDDPKERMYREMVDFFVSRFSQPTLATPRNANEALSLVTVPLHSVSESSLNGPHH